MSARLALRERTAARAPYEDAPHWFTHHGVERSEIESFAALKGGLEIVAELSGEDHAAQADFIVRAVNGYERQRLTIGELTAALETCLAKGGLDGETEARLRRAVLHVRNEAV